jgi:hypothetical protein
VKTLNDIRDLKQINNVKIEMRRKQRREESRGLKTIEK